MQLDVPFTVWYDEPQPSNLAMPINPIIFYHIVRRGSTPNLFQVCFTGNQ
jgi:hypothetical protein